MWVVSILYAYAFWVLLPVTAICAWRFGGLAEKRTGAMLLAATVATELSISKNMYQHAELLVFAVDVFLCAGLIWLALETGRLWLMLSAALQALACLAHLGKLIEPRSFMLGYQLMAEASGYPTLALLAIGVWAQYRRARRSVADTFEAS